MLQLSLDGRPRILGLPIEETAPQLLAAGAAAVLSVQVIGVRVRRFVRRRR